MNTRKLLPLVFFLFMIYHGFGQEIDRKVTGSAYANLPSGEWILGETVIGDFSSQSSTLHTGFLQSNLVSTGASERYHPDFSFIVYPNPTSGLIHISHDSQQPVNLHIYDVLGQVQFFWKKISFEEDVNITSLPSGAYLFRYGSSRGWGIQIIYKTQ